MSATRTCLALCTAGLLLAARIPLAQAAPTSPTPVRAVVTRGHAQAPECKDALLLAKSMPLSKAPDPLTPLVLPQGMRSTLSLGRPPDAAEPSALLASEDFDHLPQAGGEHAYWAKRIEAGKRIVVGDGTP